MRWGLAVIALLSACGFSPGIPRDGGGGIGSDALLDTAVDTPAVGIDGPDGCYGTGVGVRVCLAQPPTLPFHFSGVGSISTSPGSLSCAATTGPQAGNYCVIAGTDIDISGTLVGTGSRPLVLLSLSTLTISGTLDVSSRSGLGTRKGPGANPAACTGMAAGSTGGGYGGSFGSKGGDGGNSTGGKAGPAVIPTTLRGGCPGSNGVDPIAPAPGSGGGAVDLIAVTSITFSGTINASGSAGSGELPTNNGGDGAGSGGMIVFDAPALVFNGGAIFANGGGGGGGSNGNTLGAGSDGGDPLSWSVGGGGGGGAPAAGSGGSGAHGVVAAENGSAAPSSGNGGGGGAGGVGVIRVFQVAVPSGSFLSPPAT